MTDGRPASAPPAWRPAPIRVRPWRLLVAWLTNAVALYVAALLVPGASITNGRGALGAVFVIAVMNALVPPIVAAVRIPWMALAGFGVVLLVDAGMLLAADAITDDLTIDS